MTDPDSVQAALEGIEIVYHCAAVISIQGDPSGIVSHTNIGGPKTLAEACLASGIRRLVHVSSVHSLHPDPADPIDETRALVPPDYWSAYARTKAEGERHVLDAVSRGLDAVIVNPSGMIGPFDFKPSLLGQTLGHLYSGRIEVAERMADAELRREEREHARVQCEKEQGQESGEGSKVPPGPYRQYQAENQCQHDERHPSPPQKDVRGHSVAVQKLKSGRRCVAPARVFGGQSQVEWE